MRERIKRQLVKQAKRFLTERVAIDLGTVNTLIYTEKQGIILNEPSAIAINKYTGQVLEVGQAALNLLGREPVDTIVYRPMRDGTIADYDLTEKMLHEFLHHAGIKGRWGKFLHIITAAPSLATGVERRALKSAARSIGARWVSLIEEGVAAAFGAGVDLASAGARMVVDIGGGTTNITVASHTGIIQSHSLRHAGNEMTHLIMDYIAKKYRIQVGEQTAELLKIELGAAISTTEKTFKIAGKSQQEFKVKEFEITNTEIIQTIEKTIQSIIEGVRLVIEQSLPNVAVDIYQSGITLTGGGALLPGIGERMSNELTMPVRVTEHPLEAVVKGAGRLMTNEVLLNRYQMADETLEWEINSSPNYSLAG